MALLACSLFLATFGIYARTLAFDFVNYDDPGYVYKNAHVRAGLTPDTVIWAFTTGEQGNWHPLAWLSHALDWQLYGEWAGGHHLTSALIHALTTALTFLWLFRATGALWPGAIAAALFGWHPLHMESVAWVSERKDVLCAFFFVLGLYSYTEYRRSHSAWHYAAVTACLVCALLSKPMAVTFPCVLLLLDVWPLQSAVTRGRITEKAPWFALVVVHSLVTYLVQQAGENTVGLHSVPLHIRLENAAATYATYAFKTIVPTGLAVHYPYPPHGPALLHWVGGVAFLVCGSATALICMRRAPYMAVGWFWFVGMLVPVIGLVQVGTQSHADRYTYLPQIGLGIAAVWSFNRWTTHSAKVRRLAGCVAAVVVAGYAAVTWQALPVWRNSVALFTRALAVTDNNAIAHVNLGVAYYEAEDFENAAMHATEALQINPHEFNALITLGLIETKRGQWADSERLWRAILAQNPRHADAHSYLGQALEKQGKIEEAAREFARCTQLEPTHVRAHELLGGALLLLGKGEEAARAYQRAIDLDATRTDSWASLGVSLCSLGRYSESFPFFRKALELDPANADARLYYAKALALADDPSAALEQLGTLLGQLPGHAEGLALRQELERGAP